MNGLIFGLYGVYAILVAANGNAGKLSTAMQSDSKGFLPWAISIGVLSVLYDNPNTQPVAKPFIYLAILTFVLKNFTQLESQFKKLYALAGSNNSTAITVASSDDAGIVNPIKSLQLIQNTSPTDTGQ